MIPVLTFHAITSFDATPVQHFVASGNREEFWTRTLLIRGGDGGDGTPYRIDLYSYESAAALDLGAPVPQGDLGSPPPHYTGTQTNGDKR